MTALPADAGGGTTFAKRRFSNSAANSTLGGGFAIGFVVGWLIAQSLIAGVILGLIAAVAAVAAVSWSLEGRRRAIDRIAASLAMVCLLLALAPLGALAVYTISRGAKRLSPDFFSHSMARVPPLSTSGGIYAAAIGTVEQVLLASVISVPIGLMVAVYITEYGGGPLARAIRFFVDVMTGIPSIVAGLFIYVFVVIQLNMGFSGFAAALALSVLMLPIVIRSSEEMIVLVPPALREASYALGIPKWKTILRVILPTASAGITTGVMLAVARVAGETAPLILTTLGNSYINNNPFSGRQDAVSLFIYSQATQAYKPAIDRAWAGAVTLVAIVAILYIGARLMTRRNTLTRR